MKPTIPGSCFIAPSARIIGDVTLGEDVSVWFGAVIRADQTSIVIGEGSNIQDNAVIHVDVHSPTVIGTGVSVGHGAKVHGARIGNDCIIGMNAVILNDAVVEDGSIVGSNAVVKSGMKIPEGSLVLGIPCKIVRSGDGKLREKAKKNAADYRQLAKEYKDGRHHF
jgi:carbonic anhydrase/acetyltransferase-like protein (isoleucine patch superfamily)